MSKFLEQESKITDYDRLVVADSRERTSSITKILLTIAEYLDHAGDDEIGAELLKDFAQSYAEHEQSVVEEKNKINLN